MTKEIKITAKIEKIVRTNGKAEAQMVVTIPLASSAEIPLGSVSLSIQTLQSSMFDEKPKKR